LRLEDVQKVCTERDGGSSKTSTPSPKGLTSRWNSGPVEGRVNHIKMIKRQMFGRAGLSLLRKRVLLTQKTMTSDGAVTR
jgi:hypothetical protein